MSSGKVFPLIGGGTIPAVGLGTWQSKKGEVRAAVKCAIAEGGYRHIDGAAIYKNEDEVGEGIKDAGVPRKELFVTSKLWNSDHDPSKVEAALDASLSRLSLDYLDLYLMHWPVAFVKDGTKANGYKPTIDWKHTEDPMPTWRAMEELVRKGKCRHIGISNFTVEKAQKLFDAATIKPVVNQVELNPGCPQPDLLAWSKKTGVLLESYSPLGSTGAGYRDDPVVKEIAAAHKVDPANVLISWQVARGCVVLPKSVTPSRIVANFQDVNLTKDEVDRLEKHATSQPFKRAVDPGKNWGVDIFGPIGSSSKL
ncbi:Aldo/keto reductase [Meredithblackwellia eburnea MCA 4105]